MGSSQSTPRPLKQRIRELCPKRLQKQSSNPSQQETIYQQDNINIKPLADVQSVVTPKPPRISSTPEEIAQTLAEKRKVYLDSQVRHYSPPKPKPQHYELKFSPATQVIYEDLETPAWMFIGDTNEKRAAMFRRRKRLRYDGYELKQELNRAENLLRMAKDYEKATGRHKSEPGSLSPVENAQRTFDRIEKEYKRNRKEQYRIEEALYMI